MQFRFRCASPLNNTNDFSIIHNTKFKELHVCMLLRVIKKSLNCSLNWKLYDQLKTNYAKGKQQFSSDYVVMVYVNYISIIITILAFYISKLDCTFFQNRSYCPFEIS